jgi:hypothetical protein
VCPADCNALILRELGLEAGKYSIRVIRLTGAPDRFYDSRRSYGNGRTIVKPKLPAM